MSHRRPSSVGTESPSASTPEKRAAAISVSRTLHTRTKRDPLVGRFFHFFHPEPDYPDAPTRIVKWQGHVLGRVDRHTYLIELFSWDDGEPNGQRLQAITEMADWRFYETADAMNDWYYDVYSPLARRKVKGRPLL